MTIGNPDLRGRRVRMAAADHEHAGKVGIVTGQEPCALCAARCSDEPCGYDDLIVEIQPNLLTRVYEPEAELVGEEEKRDG